MTVGEYLISLNPINESVRDKSVSSEFKIGIGNLKRLYGDTTPKKEELVKDAGLYADKTKNIDKKEFIKYVLTQVSSI